MVRKAIDRPNIHCVVYGVPGGGKSWFASTFPYPMLVWLFDPIGKGIAYVKRGDRSEYDTESDTTLVYKGDKEIVRVENYTDIDPEKPRAFKDFQARIRDFFREKEYEDYKTVVLDSLTYMQFAAINLAQKNNPTMKDIRRLYFVAKELMQPIVMHRMPNIPCNVVVTAHVYVDKDEETGRVLSQGPSAPGNIKDRVGAGYTELYHIYNEKKGGEAQYWLQTRSDRHFPAFSAVCEAPDPCENEYDALWENYDG